ncbi:hypothetical protein VKT23_010896 [Stygiomarasmius scandens]|uniref:Uncharacterized protein n=1 Tax=Marasmiellus scandens TaxID=2682957 RepID=A0ABR1JBE8_9AGAR
MQFRLVVAFVAACVSGAVYASPAVENRALCAGLVSDCLNKCADVACDQATCESYCRCTLCKTGASEACIETCKPEGF